MTDARSRPPAPAPAPRTQGHSTPADGVQTPSMALPHERDQATDQTQSAPHPEMQQAHADIENGQVDTDLRATPGLDAARRDAMVPKSKP